MKGLLRKDILSLKSTFVILAGFMLVYAAIGVVGNNSSMLTAVLAIVIMMLPVNSVSYDEFYHWDKYVLTMPVSRKMVVQSKYVLCFLLVGFMLAVGTVFSVLLDGNFADAFFNTLIVASMALLFSVLSLPCVIKWGASRGRMILVLMCAAAGSIMGILLFSLKEIDLTQSVVGSLFAFEAVLIGMVTLAIIATVVSYVISLRLYERKQF